MFDVVTLTMNPAVDLYTSVSRVESEHKLRCDVPEVHAGGGGINVARVVARFGRLALAVYAAGGRTGEWLHDLLDDDDVVQRRVSVSTTARENITVLDRSTARQYRFVMPGIALGESEWRACLASTVAAARRTGTVVASGSLPPGVPDELYALLAESLGGLDVQLVLDTAGAPLRAALDHGVAVVSPNRRELDELAGRPLDADARIGFAEQLVADGRAEVVVVKLDADGALVCSHDGSVEIAAPAVDARSAVGAGDSFLGAFVVARDAGWTLADAARLGVAAGSAAVSMPGTELVRPHALAGLWSRMTARPMPPLAAL